MCPTLALAAALIMSAQPSANSVEALLFVGRSLKRAPLSLLALWHFYPFGVLGTRAFASCPGTSEASANGATAVFAVSLPQSSNERAARGYKG